MELKNLRRKIDNLDKNIIKLLNLRAKITLDVAKVKGKKRLIIDYWYDIILVWIKILF